MAVARQYGTIFTNEDITATCMSFEEKSKWLKPCHCCSVLSLSTELLLPDVHQEQSSSYWRTGGLCYSRNRFMSNNNLMIHEIVKSLLCIFNRTHWRLHNLILSSESSWMTLRSLASVDQAGSSYCSNILIKHSSQGMCSKNSSSFCQSVATIYRSSLKTNR